MSVSIIITEDDEDDYQLMRCVLTHSRVGGNIHWAKDGEQLLDFLNRRGAWKDSDALPSPLLVLLDLNMPRMGGREALRAIRADPRFRRVPVIIVTTSALEEDVRDCYDLGANSYIRKLGDLDKFAAGFAAFERYWLETVELPDGRN